MNQETIAKLQLVELRVDALMDYATALREALVAALAHVPKPMPADVHALVCAAKARLKPGGSDG